jgi:putative membrane protein
VTRPDPHGVPPGTELPGSRPAPPPAAPTGLPTAAPTEPGPGTGRPGAGGAPDPAATPWRRLDPRMLIVGPLGSLVRLLPFVVLFLVAGQGADTVRIWVAVGAAVALVAAGVLRWHTTRYRITGERVELHSGWLRRQRRAVPRDRIRTVDLTSRLLHRAFGLSVVQIGSASVSIGDSASLNLDAVTTAEAERLRRVLLERSPAAAAQSGAPDVGRGAATVTEPGPPPEQLASLRWSWLRFAPLTVSSLAGIGAVGAALFNIVDDLGVSPRDIEAVDDAADRLATAPVWFGVAVLGSILLTVAVIGSLVLFAERWWDYRLTREPDGSLRLRRGMLTRRSLSVSEHRLRGVEISEPLLLRAGRGAQCRALTTGLTEGGGGGALQPPAPRAESHRVAAVALREHPAQITRAPLRRHPPAARVRRLSRALLPASVVVVVGFLAGSTAAAPDWIGPVSLGLLALAALVGLDRYRSLGHELTARYVVSRSGSLRRRTVALQRTGIVGWAFRQSVFQRRAGLVTLEAVTAAGEGGYPVVDLAANDAVALADAATPGLLSGFRSHPPAPPPAGPPPAGLPPAGPHPPGPHPPGPQPPGPHPAGPAPGGHPTAGHPTAEPPPPGHPPDRPAPTPWSAGPRAE